ncbi:AMP-binding protein [Bacillus sp. N3536]|nr:AMP-binding protein [Bacillus sp. N3536]
MFTEQAWIYKRAILSPSKKALIDSSSGKVWTYHTLWEQIKGWANYFESQGFEAGDRIAVLSQNRIELFAILFACGLKGLIYVPLNYRLSTNELQDILNNCSPVTIIYDENHIELSEFFPTYKTFLLSSVTVSHNSDFHFNTDWKPDDPWLIIYTGGTTGSPKGAVLSFDNVNWNAINTIISWGLNDEDCTLNYMPMFHTGGLNALCIPILMAGGTVVTGKRFQAEEALKFLDIYKTTLSLFVPTMYQAMLETEYIKKSIFPTVKCFLSGGAPCPRAIYNRFEKMGILFKEGYGLTEAGPNNFFIEPQLARLKKGTVGKCMQFNEVKVINEYGKPCQSNEVGELYVSGRHVFKQYWNNEQETVNTFEGKWLKTGDLAMFDEEGDFFIVGRKKEMIISGGENIYPIEIEQLLAEHPNVREAAVLGIEDDKWGECVTAFISYASSPQSEQELIAYCKATLGSYKVPKKIYFLEELPRTDVGKIDKKTLKEMALKAVK